MIFYSSIGLVNNTIKILRIRDLFNLNQGGTEYCEYLKQFLTQVNVNSSNWAFR